MSNKMAKIAELNDSWYEWVKSRPPIIQALCEKLPPDRLYLMKSTDHRVTMYSYSENGTVTVCVLADYNLIMFERKVFGIDPDDLVECDLPDANESVGAILTEEKDILAYCEYIRGN